MGFRISTVIVSGNNMVLMINPMRIWVRLVLNWKFLDIFSRFFATLSAIGCTHDMNHYFLCYRTHSYLIWLIHVWHDSFICDMTHSCVTWLIHVWHDSFICGTTPYLRDEGECLFTCVTHKSTSATHCNTLQHVATHCNTLQHTATHLAQIHMCDEQLNSFCVTWLIHTWHASIYSYVPMTHYVCNWTHSYVWHDSFISDTWLIRMCDMTHSYVRHDSFVCVAWLITMTHLHVPWLIYVLTHMCYDSFITCAVTHSYVLWLIHMCHDACVHVCHDSNMPWLIQMCHDPFTYSMTPMCYDLFTCDLTHMRLDAYLPWQGAYVSHHNCDVMWHIHDS